MRPIPGDPGHAEILHSIAQAGTDWWLAAEGEYETFALEAMKDDGSDHQVVIAMVLPAKRNNLDEYADVQMMMSPEDALGLARNLMHTAMWLKNVGLA